jgi:hypothetical protein
MPTRWRRRGGGIAARCDERHPGRGDRQDVDDAQHQMIEDALDREVRHHGAGEFAQRIRRPFSSIGRGAGPGTARERTSRRRPPRPARSRRPTHRRPGRSADRSGWRHRASDHISDRSNRPRVFLRHLDSPRRCARPRCREGLRWDARGSCILTIGCAARARGIRPVASIARVIDCGQCTPVDGRPSGSSAVIAVTDLCGTHNR